MVVNEDAFTKHNLQKAGYDANPLEDGSLDDYQLFCVPMTSMTVRATEDIEGVTSRDAARSKNLFALGLVSWLYGRPTEPTIEWIEGKFADKPPVKDANIAAFRAGYNFGETAELFAVHYEIDAAPADSDERTEDRTDGDRPQRNRDRGRNRNDRDRDRSDRNDRADVTPNGAASGTRTGPAYGRQPLPTLVAGSSSTCARD